MDLFKIAESFKEKFDSDNNWKTEWFYSDIYFLRWLSVTFKEIYRKWNFLLYLTKNKKQSKRSKSIIQLHNHNF